MSLPSRRHAAALPCVSPDSYPACERTGDRSRTTRHSHETTRAALMNEAGSCSSQYRMPDGCLFLLPCDTFDRARIHRLLAVTGITCLSVLHIRLFVISHLEYLRAQGLACPTSFARIKINYRYLHALHPPFSWYYDIALSYFKKSEGFLSLESHTSNKDILGMILSCDIMLPHECQASGKEERLAS